LATHALPAAAPKSRTRLWLALGALGLIGVVIIAVLVLRAPRLTVPNDVPPGGSQPSGAPPVAVKADMTEAIAQLRRDFAQANSLALQGQADQARRNFADVAEQAEKQLEAKNIAPEQQSQLRIIAGESWLAANAPVKAQAQFDILVRQAPGNAEMQTALAATQLLQDNLDAADTALSRALRANTDYAAAHALKACVLLKRNEPLAAVREFRQSGLADIKTPVPPWVRLVLADLDCRPERFKQ
jgi:tetratricopeptide (TPR) repeat protein